MKILNDKSVALYLTQYTFLIPVVFHRYETLCNKHDWFRWYSICRKHYEWSEQIFEIIIQVFHFHFMPASYEANVGALWRSRKAEGGEGSHDSQRFMSEYTETEYIKQARAISKVGSTIRPSRKPSRTDLWVTQYWSLRRTVLYQLHW